MGGGSGEGSGSGGGGWVDVIEELEFLGKFTQKKFFFGGMGSGWKIILGGGGGGGGGSGVWVVGGGGGGGGVRVDVIEELKFLGKFTQKKFGGGGMGSGWK